MKEALEGIVAAELDALDFELVEFRRGGTKRRPVLDVRIDHRDGSAVTVDDCAKASRAIEARLDGSDLVAENYVLEVGSPGVERPLRNAAEWRRFVGKHASVLSDALGGREEVEVVGVEGEPGVEVAVVKDRRGDVRRIPMSEVREARLVFRW